MSYYLDFAKFVDLKPIFVIVVTEKYTRSDVWIWA